MTRTPLCELADKYGTNKAQVGYTPIYWNLLKTRKYSTRRVLEVGIGGPGLSGGPSMHAGSLFMWEEFFPEAEILGIDIRTELLLNKGRIISRWGNVDQPLTISDAAMSANRDPFEKYDLIIDDAVHTFKPQRDTMEALLPFLAHKGIYVIEDVVNCSPADFVPHVPKGYGFATYNGNDPYKLVVITRAD